MIAAIAKLQSSPRRRADMKVAQDALKNIEPSERKKFESDLQTVVLRAVNAAVEMKSDA